MNIYYPVKQPINQTNLFAANPAQYKPIGQNGHPGNDFMAPSGTPLYAPCDGDAFYTFDSNGGDGIYIRVTSGTNHYNVILWHLFQKGNAKFPFSIPTDGTITPVKAGQLLGYTDNSGFPVESTGPHLHLGVMRCNDNNWTALNPGNGFMGCIDPSPFYNGKFAQDISTEEEIVQDSEKVVTIVVQSNLPIATKLSLLEKVEEFLHQLFFKQ